MRSFRGNRAALFVAGAIVCVALPTALPLLAAPPPGALGQSPPLATATAAGRVLPGPMPTALTIDPGRVGVYPTHESTEALLSSCPTTFHYGIDLGVTTIDLASDQEDLGRLFPEWWEVGAPNVRDHRTGATYIDRRAITGVTVLEGTVVSKTFTPDGSNTTDHRGGKEYTPHVSYDDTPIAHFTHDLNIHVLPDRTPDNRYTSLLGVQVKQVRVDPCEADRAMLLRLMTQLATGNFSVQGQVAALRHKLASPACKTQRLADQKSQQGVLEVEWESGMGADNDGNPCSAANRRGDSCGFASAGHKRGQEIWNFPTEGDHVHIEGSWIWDRGHPPADTEIHSPRLLVVRRKLPDIIVANGSPLRISPANFVSTRADVFANGDGNVFANNTKGPYANDYGVRPVIMSHLDYTFTIENTVARPGPGTGLGWAVAKHDGDTFPAEPIITAYPNGSPTKPEPHVEVTIPWKSAHAPDTAIFARSIHVYWNDAASAGVAPAGRPRIFQVTLENINIRDTNDGDENGELRMFADVAGHWLFLNELYPGDPLRSGLGDTGKRSWPINRRFTVYVPPQGRFRVHSSGWDADGANLEFGKLIDPNTPCSDTLRNKIVQGLNVLKDHDGLDDPMGEAAFAFVPGPGRVQGYVKTIAGAGDKVSDALGGDTDPTALFTVTFRVDEQTWPPPAPPPGPGTVLR